MKKQFLYTLVLLFLAIGIIKAQIVPTTDQSKNLPAYPIWEGCISCVPSGWTGSSTPSGHLPSVSSIKAYGSWYNTSLSGVEVSLRHIFKPFLPSLPSGNLTFLSINNTTSVKTFASTTITNLIPGRSYTLKFNLSTAKIEYDYKKGVGSGNDIESSVSGYATSATVEVGGIAVPVAKTITFTGNITDKWIPESITFKASSTTATLKFSGTGDNASPGISNLDIVGIDNVCAATSNQIVMNTTKLNACFGATVLLNDASLLASVPAGTPSNLPFGFEFQVFDNPNHTGNPITFTAKSGTYYYFFYDKIAKCYNTNNSTAKLEVSFTEEQQVPLYTTVLTNKCIGGQSDLNSALKAVRGDYSVVWFKTASHLGKVDTPGAVGAGTYYAFYYDKSTGCYLTHNSLAKVEVKDPAELQVSLTGNSLKKNCLGETANLNSMISGAIPAGLQVTWFTSDTPIAPNKVADPEHAGAGNYYAFYYDIANQCYKALKSTSLVNVTLAREEQVPLSGNSITKLCVGETADLSVMFSGILPINWKIYWFTSDVPALGTQVANPKSVGAGTYYAAYYDLTNQCFKTLKSTSAVNVIVAPEQQVPLKGNTLKKACMGETANLNSMLNGVVPMGLKVYWFTDQVPALGGQMIEPGYVGAGTYYAVYYDINNNCFKTKKSTSVVTVTAEEQVPLVQTTSTNICPATTVNLNSMVKKGAAPTGAEIVWYTTPDHIGNKVADPTVAGAGTYYAFTTISASDCYNTNASTAKVTVTLAQCNLASVTLNTKVFLQGALDGTIMHNLLQTYFQDGTGLLPTSDPYVGTTTYSDIANVQGVAGAVVDWVRVEVRSSVDPAIILEAQSLLLRTDGKVVNTEGNEPVFQSQATPVRLVVKHRNHLPVMSTDLNFSGTSASYDFTTALSQASNEFGDPDQMLQVNGVWSMIAGDVQQDLSVDNVDLSLFYNAFNQGDFDVYSNQDLNLDGVVDNQDIFYFDNSFNAGYFSTIINY